MTHAETDNFTHNRSRLSVQVSLNGLSFLISDDLGETVFFKQEILSHSTTPEELLLELEKLFLHLPQNRDFADIAVVYSTPVATVVPLDFFDETRGSEYLKFNSKILVNDYVAHDKLDDHNLAVVYVPFMNINNSIFEKLGSFDYYHSTTILLKRFLSKFSEEFQVYIHVGPHFFDCIVVKEGKLKLCNSYPYTTPEDFLYYLLFVLEQLELDPEKVSVFFCGRINHESSLFSLAYEYIRNIEFIQEPQTEEEIPFVLKSIF